MTWRRTDPSFQAERQKLVLSARSSRVDVTTVQATLSLEVGDLADVTAGNPKTTYLSFLDY